MARARQLSRAPDTSPIPPMDRFQMALFIHTLTAAATGAVIS
ncbi:hypothetical protein BH09GEM1_BH09GEM1_32460 [soil metagenome]